MPLRSDANAATPLRIGVFGGTFDPIHLGHLMLAEEARSRLALAQIYFVPVGTPPHKQHRTVTPAEHRVRMVELATAACDAFLVSRIDVDRAGPHYSSDMIALLRATVEPTAELFFLVGMDSLEDLHTWHQPEQLLAHCRLVALSRPGSAPDWPGLEAKFPNIRERVSLLDMPEMEISSTALRDRVRTGQTIRYQVPRAVEAYIRKNKLYAE